MQAWFSFCLVRRFALRGVWDGGCAGERLSAWHGKREELHGGYFARTLHGTAFVATADGWIAVCMHA